MRYETNSLSNSINSISNLKRKKKNTSADNIHELKLYLQDGLTTCGQEAALNSGDKHGVLKSNHLDSNPASACREVKDKWWDFSTYVSLSEK